MTTAETTQTTETTTPMTTAETTLIMWTLFSFGEIKSYVYSTMITFKSVTYS
jgi:hypothetical protein